jgi:hypothetical protein
VSDRTVESADGWAEAHTRVRAYFRSHGVAPARAEELAGQVVRFARERRASVPDRTPVEVAGDAAMLLIDGWIQTLVGTDPAEAPDRRFAHERAAVHLAGLPARWPEHFLADTPAPEAMRAELRRTWVESGPDLEFTPMVPRPIDLGPVSDVADTTWRTFDQWPFLRGVATWLLYLGALAAAFYAVRF